jgi:four helix bundle protein
MEASKGTAEAGIGTNSFKNLELWKMARSLGLDCFQLARQFPRDDATRVVTRQFVGRSTSVRANIAEGHGRYSKAAYRNHLSIARGSAAETEEFVDLLASAGILTDEQGRDLTSRCQQMIAALTRAMKALENDLRSAKSIMVRETPPTYDSTDFVYEADDFELDAPMFNAPMRSEDPE